MLTRGMSLVTEAAGTGTALAAITTYTLESIRAVCLAAERAGRPVILQAGSSSAGAVGVELLVGGVAQIRVRLVGPSAWAVGAAVGLSERWDGIDQALQDGALVHVGHRAERHHVQAL